MCLLHGLNKLGSTVNHGRYSELIINLPVKHIYSRLDSINSIKFIKYTNKLYFNQIEILFCEHLIAPTHEAASTPFINISTFNT